MTGERRIWSLWLNSIECQASSCKYKYYIISARTHWLCMCVCVWWDAITRTCTNLVQFSACNMFACLWLAIYFSFSVFFYFHFFSIQYIFFSLSIHFMFDRKRNLQQFYRKCAIRIVPNINCQFGSRQNSFAISNVRVRFHSATHKNQNNDNNQELW